MKNLTLFILLLVFSCSNTSKNKSKIDSFYTEKGEWDSARIPLIKPYEAIIVMKESGWAINLEGYDGDTGFDHVKKVTVSNNMILVYYVNSLLHGKDVIEAWRVIVPAKHTENGFSTYQEYRNYLNKLGIKSEPTLHDIESVAKYYEYHNTVDWNAIK